MADVLNTAMAWLADLQTDHASESVSIRRGTHTTTGVPAMIAMQDEPVLDTYGALVTPQTDLGFGIDRAEYTINGEAVAPKAGDVIIRTALTGEPEYEVAQPSSSEKVWEDADGYQLKMLVHAKRVS
jgi:hypothetical protein